MALEGAQPLKISLPVSAALAQALYNEDQAAGAPAQYTFVLVNASGFADLVANASDVPIGVIQNRPFVMSQTTSQVGGGAAEIVVVGVTKVRVGTGGFTLSATTPGNLIEFSVASNHVGTAIQAGAATGGAKCIVGQVLTAQGLGANAGGSLQTLVTTYASGVLARAIVNCVFPLPTGN
jgi:hypothetical protein